MSSFTSGDPSQISRRHFLGHLRASALGVPAVQFFTSLQANADQVRKNHRSCIVLWMSGGPSHLDIWDLKPESDEERRAVPADRHLGSGRARSASTCPGWRSRCII